MVFENQPPTHNHAVRKDLNFAGGLVSILAVAQMDLRAIHPRKYNELNITMQSNSVLRSQASPKEKLGKMLHV